MNKFSDILAREKARLESMRKNTKKLATAGIIELGVYKANAMFIHRKLKNMEVK